MEIPDPTIIKHRRTWIAKENRVGEMEISHLFSESPGDNEKSLKFKVEDPNRLVSDLKRDVRIKSKLPVERRVFLLNKHIILTDEHVLADLFLDFENLSLTLLDNRDIENREDFFYPFVHSTVIPLVDILIPRIYSEDCIVEYPLYEIGDMRFSVMKSWVEAIFRIPVEEHELQIEFLVKDKLEL